MTLELVCRAILGITAAAAGSYVKGMFFGGHLGGTAAGLTSIAVAVGSKESCEVISKDMYMRDTCPKLVEGHREALGGIPHALGVLPAQAYNNEKDCAPYLPGGSKYWGPTPTPQGQLPQYPYKPDYVYRPDLASQGHNPSQGGG